MVDEIKDIEIDDDIEEDETEDETVKKDDTLFKTDVIELLMLKGNFTKSEATRCLDSLIEIITDNIRDGIKVQIKNFCTFHPVNQDAYTARNPRTGEPVEVEAKKSMKVKLSKKFKLDLN